MLREQIKALVFKSLDRRAAMVVMKHPDSRITVIPLHRGEELGRGILREIMKDTKISRDIPDEMIEESKKDLLDV